VRRFATYSALVLVVLLAGAFVVGSQLARAETLREARVRGASMARVIIGPLVNKDVRAYRPGAADRLASVANDRLRDGSLAHVKVWAADGRVIWSDQADLVGRRYDLSPQVRALFGTTKVSAEISDLQKDENIEERSEGSLIEVYAGAADVDRQPVVVESYVPVQQLDRDQRAMILALFALALGALLLFQVAVIPLALSLARRVERSKEDREKLIKHALLASDMERRRIAQDLHDGVIPDLAGLGYLLPTLQRQVAAGEAGPEVAANLSRVGEILTRDVAALRSLLTDIYPPDLQGEGLINAIEDLARESVHDDAEIEVRAEPGLTLPPESAALAYRVLREGLRNVAKHAQATRVVTDLRCEGDQVVASVTDNGVGINGHARNLEGHLGLRLLADTMNDVGGVLEVSSPESGGTRLQATFPVQLTSR